MVQAVSRAFEILRLIADSADGLRLYELADLMNLKRTTVFNLSKTLIEEGALVKADDTRYRLGPAMRELYLRQRDNAHGRMAEDELLRFHRKYPESVMVYSELGQYDILGQIYIGKGIDVQAQHPDDMSLNPYLTVCGLIFFAFAPGERINGVKVRHPFAYKGLEAWGSEDKFWKYVELTRQNGYAESPMTPTGEMKLGIPVFCPGGVKGAITFGIDDPGEELRKIILEDLKELAGRLK